LVVVTRASGKGSLAGAWGGELRLLNAVLVVVTRASGKGSLAGAWGGELRLLNAVLVVVTRAGGMVSLTCARGGELQLLTTPALNWESGFARHFGEHVDVEVRFVARFAPVGEGECPTDLVALGRVTVSTECHHR
jgi:hypothetical protein